MERTFALLFTIAKVKNIPRLLLFLDFGNVFFTQRNGLSFEKPFNFFGFGSSSPESCVLNSGWASDFIEIPAKRC